MSYQSELQLYWRERTKILTPICFFVVVVSLFPLSMGTDEGLLQSIAPGVIWVCALLAALMALEPLFRMDWEQGVIDQWLLSGKSLPFLLAQKIAAHWTLTALPLVILSPLLAMFLRLDFASAFVLFISLLLGTPVFSLMGSILTALLISTRPQTVLLPLLLLPLFVPVLIFGTLSVQAVSVEMPFMGYLFALAAISVLSMTLAPFACATALKIGAER